MSFFMSLKFQKGLVITLNIGIFVENLSKILVRNPALGNGIRIHVIFRSVQGHVVGVAPLFSANMGPDIPPYYLFNVRRHV